MRNEWRCWLRLGAAALAIGMASLSPAADEQPGSQPNRFSGTSVMQVNAVVLALDPGRNSMTLLQDNGDAFDVVVDPGIGDVDRLQLGDTSPSP